jgi:rhamnulokinase
LDLPASMMPELLDPGTGVGELRESARRAVGLKCGVVVAPCTHDSASAVAAIPATSEDWAFLSSGTWSVLGALTERPIVSKEAFLAGVCNELTLQGFFLCRNIMGLWLLQQARAGWQQRGEDYSYGTLTQLAQRASDFDSLVHPDDPSFYAPADMNKSIREFCAQTGQRQPEEPDEISRCILASLALCYKQRLDQISHLLGREFRMLYIVGGGSRNSLLCQFTANATGLPVLAGPAEATVMGNLLVQALAVGALASPEEIRYVARSSSTLVEYTPQNEQRWQDDYGRYLRLLQ